MRMPTKLISRANHMMPPSKLAAYDLQACQADFYYD